MSRSDIPDVANRRPFYLYVDEFQNFATDSFSVILSEARKYGLNLTVANQYVAQMTESVRDAVFGNVGTTISFRVSADDAPILVKQFEPTFEASDLLQLNNRNFVISMIINGEKVPAFSATTLSIPDSPQDNFDAIIEHSRKNFARPRLEVEAEIRETIEQSEKYKKELSDSGRQANDATPVFTHINSGSNEKKQSMRTEQKPNLKYRPTPQADFRRQSISPNVAEGKDRPGLKDLAKLVIEKTNNEEGNKNSEQKGNKESSEKQTEKLVKKSLDKQSVKKKTDDKPLKKNKQKSGKKDNNKPAIKQNSKSSNSKTEVKPEVEYQEKSVVNISTNNTPVSLSTPIKHTEDFADKDNSVDGFLSIKH